MRYHHSNRLGISFVGSLANLSIFQVPVETFAKSTSSLLIHAMDFVKVLNLSFRAPVRFGDFHFLFHCTRATTQNDGNPSEETLPRFWCFTVAQPLSIVIIPNCRNTANRTHIAKSRTPP
jgi:hypothetical protein